MPCDWRPLISVCLWTIIIKLNPKHPAVGKLIASSLFGKAEKVDGEGSVFQYRRCFCRPEDYAEMAQLRSKHYKSDYLEANKKKKRPFHLTSWPWLTCPQDSSLNWIHLLSYFFPCIWLDLCSYRILISLLSPVLPPE